jgi:hypothetical protein
MLITEHEGRWLAVGDAGPQEHGPDEWLPANVMMDGSPDAVRHLAGGEPWDA